MNYTLELLRTIKMMINVEFCEVSFEIIFGGELRVSMRAPIERGGEWFNYQHTFTEGEITNTVVSDATMVGRLVESFKIGYVNAGGKL